METMTKIRDLGNKFYYLSHSKGFSIQSNEQFSLSNNNSEDSEDSSNSSNKQEIEDTEELFDL
jgi:hypothetical protein